MSGSDTLSQNDIDKLLSSLTAGLEQDQSEAQYEAAMIDTFDEDRKGYKLYNFRRPDKFSKDHLKALQDIHKEFSRQLSLILSTYLRLNMEIDVVSVDQLTYDEFSRSLPNPVTIGVLELNPLPGQIFLGVSHEILSSIVDRMLGGVGHSESKARELTDIEEALAKRVFDKIIKTLEKAWKNVFPVRGAVVGIDTNSILSQLASPGEVVALITLEIQVANKYSGLLSLCFPYPVLETVIEQLNTQQIYQTKGKLSSMEDKQKILNKISNTNVKINVMLGSTDITIGDFIDLKIGDVIRLENSINDKLVVKVNNIPKFLGRPGTKKNKVSINIVDKIKQTDDDF
ncbi:MAG: flagellar motor switch protein FliM [Candidatus Melainabacteria bacterium GWA2_34_9]|nr:MAG: flagellar motor switch protein FliM [Candidatus Melainabacteria bacterium GWA2_34_9]